ncbi:phage portal protein [Cytobacillus firmus]|uniref:Phage portal protein, HK97 family n=1 Tax=Cytobacillus firmus DS1 TaxID=1307436 RepID=W7KN45_CYTFI|nr:phage portal protein [Cytobacillus firmus]EWG08895.1 phage portal protein, HK97 family [Cytobacillus firmus DS1]
MGWTDMFKGLLFKDGTLTGYEINLDLILEYQYKKLAVETCIDLIANAISTCEFQTFEKGVQVRKNNYYLFNVSPNQNQNSSEFLHELVHHLCYDNECLVIMQDGMLYVADDYETVEYAMKENYYKNVQVGEFTFNKNFRESEVLHFKLSDENIRKVIDLLYESYGKILSSAMGIYKRANAKRFLVKGKFLKSHNEKEQEAANELFNRQFKAWLEADKAGAMMHIGDNVALEDMSGNGKGGNPVANSRDIRALVDDIFDFTALGFHVPKALLKGDLADIEKQVDSFLMFCIKPIANLLNAEFNRKIFEKEEYLQRSYIKIDTSKIKILDIVNLATAADKFFAIGVNSINDNLELLGREPLNEDWADKRFVTKNYQMVEDVESLEGGE